MAAVQTNPTQMPANNTFQPINPLNNNSMQINKMPAPNMNVSMAFTQQPPNMPPVNMMPGKTEQVALQQQHLKQQQLQQQLKSNAMPPINNKLGGNAALMQLNMNIGMMGMAGMPGNVSSNGSNNMLGPLDKSLNVPPSIMSNLLNDNKMSLLNNFDEVEQSLASMEQPNLAKGEMDPITNMDMLSDMNSLMTKTSQDQTLMQQLGFDSMQSGPPHDSGNNGFSLDPSISLNGLGGVPGSRNGSGSGNMGMLNMPQMSHHNSQQPGQMPSIFDPSNVAVSRSITSIASAQNQPPTSIGGGNGVSTNPIIPGAGGFRPKPIEELLQNHDKKTPPPMDASKSGGHLASAFNKSMEQHLKNPIASSWSSLAAASSPQNTPTSNKPKQPAMAMDSFQQFRNKAKEKMDKQKLLELQEMRRSHKEAEEKRQQLEQQQKLKRDEVDASRYVFSLENRHSFAI